MLKRTRTCQKWSIIDSDSYEREAVKIAECFFNLVWVFVATIEFYMQIRYFLLVVLCLMFTDELFIRFLLGNFVV